MTGLEVPVLALCAAVVRSSVKIWLGDKNVAADVTAQAVDILADRTTGVMEKRRLRRMFESMEELITQRLQPLLDAEFRGLPDNEKIAAVEAARSTFEDAALTDDDLFAADLDAAYVYRYLVRTVPGRADEAGLSAAAVEFYHRLLRECCSYLVQITTTLPAFQPGVLTELLRRDTEILDLVRNLLARMPQRQGPHDFQADYLTQVRTSLDRMSFFGVPLSTSSRQYPLSVAYLSLSASRSGALNDEAFSDSALDQTSPRIEDLLARTPRLFVRGEAGSGKSTLLQWIAVRCAVGDRRSARWGRLTPFLIRLRRYAAAPLPTPERFLDDVGRHISDEMPPGWVHHTLRAGEAIVLIDGVDELPRQRREEAREWLRGLVDTFPSSHYVITSRPAAVDANWLRGDGYIDADLQPLTPTEVRAFVLRWHDAMRAQSVDADERAALDDYQHQLLEAINTRASLRRIAETPLLCALVCALHRDRRGQLPDNRMELYEITLHMLLERRDEERGIQPPIGLARTEKTLLLQDVAYWLLRNALSDAESGRVADRIAAKLRSMPQVRAGAEQVLQYLLERTGLLRELTVGRVDFVHRTFQEYLAAKAAIDADDIGVLVENAHLDHWREVVVMAAGHASRRQREELLAGVVRRDDGADRDRRQLQLLGVACLETSPELSDQLRNEIRSRAKNLLPPRSPHAARALAAAGDFAIDLLMKSTPSTTNTVRATIQAACYVGGDSAMRLIARFATDRRPDVVRELLQAWPRFDPIRYAESVLHDSPLLNGRVRIDDTTLIPGLSRLPALRELDCRFYSGHGDLGFASTLTSLETLLVTDALLTDLAPLATTRLTRLGLLPTDADGQNVLDLAALRTVTQLRRVDLLVPTVGWHHLADLPALVSLHMGPVHDVSRLAELPRLAGLHTLGLRDLTGLTDLVPLDFLDNPRSVGLTNCPDLVDVQLLRRWTHSLDRLWLRNCPRAELESVAALDNLGFLDLSGSDVHDLSFLRGARKLASLRVGQHARLPDLAPLAALPRLKHLWLYDTPTVDLTPLAGKDHLIVYVNRTQTVLGAERLGTTSKVERR